MNKEEFIRNLTHKLMVLNDQERADILLEYEQHIEMKVASGLSEEQAIEDFGDLDDLAKEILDAYHINTTYQANNFHHKLNYYIKNCAHFLTTLTESIFQKSKGEIGQIVLKFLGLFLFLFGLKFLLSLGTSMLHPIINLLPHFLSYPLFRVLYFIADVIHFIIAIYLTIFFIKKYVMVDYAPIIDDEQVASASFHPVDTTAAKETLNSIKQKTVELKDKVAAQPSTVSFSETCFKIIEWAIKLTAIFILLPLSLIIFGLVIAAGLLMVLAFQGISCVGIAILLFGAMLVGIAAFGGIYHFVFGGDR